MAISFATVDALPSQAPSVNISNAPVSSGGSTSVWQSILNAAKSITPEQIDNAKDLVASGYGLYTTTQAALKNNSTNPALLPKTQAIKDAEYILGLPYTDSRQQIAGINSSTWLMIGMAIIALIVVIVLVKK